MHLMQQSVAITDSVPVENFKGGGIEMQEEITTKEKFMILGKLIINCCSPDEIDMLCTALLHTNMQYKIMKKKVDAI